MNIHIEYKEQILALFPNTFGCGYAFFKNEFEPKHSGVVRIQPPNNARCIKRIDAMVETYEPNIILLPTPDGKQNRKKKRIQELLADIALYAKKRDIEVKTYSREQIKMVFEQFEARSKFDISEKICLWMPELEKYKPVKRRGEMPEDYYQGMFDSISLFLTHQYITS